MIRHLIKRFTVWYKAYTAKKRYMGLLFLSLGGCSVVEQESSSCKISSEAMSITPIIGDTLSDFQVAITVEKSPSIYTDEAADILAGSFAPSAFFIEGKKVTDEEVLERLRNRGILIGNGTFSGNKLTDSALPAGEIRSTEKIIQDYVVGDMYLFQAPHQQFSEKLGRYFVDQGLSKYVGPIGGDIQDPDGTPIDQKCWASSLSAGECSQIYLGNLGSKKKGILRLTDGYPQLTGLLLELIPALRTAGFNLVRLDEVPGIKKDLQLRGFVRLTTISTVSSFNNSS